MIGILTVVRLYLIVVLMCIFQIITDFKHLFIYLLVISKFSLEKWLFKSFAQLYLGVFFCNWIVRVPYIFCILTLCQYMACKYFLPFWRLHFHSIDCSFAMQKLLSLMQLLLSIFAFVDCTFGVIFKKSLSRPMSWRFSPMFSSRSFIVSGITFKV